MRKRAEGFAMPVGSSPYHIPPYPWKEADLLLVEFEADQRAMQAEVPAPLELLPDDRMMVWFFDAPMLAHDWYHEGAILLKVKYRGIKGIYVPYIWGDCEEAVLVNRELYGWPELMSDPGGIKKTGNLMCGEIRRRNELIMKASVFLERPAKGEELAPELSDWLQLRKFPSPVEGAAPLRQIVHISIPLEKCTLHELWAGRGNVEFGKSAQFAVERFQPKRVVNGFYTVISFDLPYASKTWHV